MNEESDDEWKARVGLINDPLELLRELVILNLEVGVVDDPYYADLYQAIIEQAIVIVKK